MNQTDTAPRECPCYHLLPKHIRTNHEDDAIVFDVITEVTHRCRLCGRRFIVQMIPGDALLGSNPASQGVDGRPLISLIAAKRGDYDEKPDDGGEWKPREDDD